MKIGIISDTHNHLDGEITRIFAGVTHILHAGDVGSRVILRQLEGIAPTTAVAGNTDDPAMGYAETELVELAGRRFLLHHIVNPYRLDDRVCSLIQTKKPDVVVFGHTHKPFSEVVADQQFFNPGYAGKSRFGMRRSVAVLDLDAPGFAPAFVYLDT